MGFKLKKPKFRMSNVTHISSTEDQLKKYSHLERRWAKGELAKQGLILHNTTDKRVVEFLNRFYAAKKAKRIKELKDQQEKLKEKIGEYSEKEKHQAEEICRQIREKTEKKCESKD